MLSKDQDNFQTGSVIYQVTILGEVHERWAGWLDGFETTPGREIGGKPVTILKGIIADQSELRGLLTRLWDLNAVVIAVRQTGQDYSNLENSQNGEKDS